jgi:fido (protein-threonine AMPylation protein)
MRGLFALPYGFAANCRERGKFAPAASCLQIEPTMTRATAPKRPTNEMALLLADHLASRSVAMSIEQLAREMYGERSAGPHHTTLWRWMNLAVERGLVEAIGDGRSTRFQAAGALRRQALCGYLAQPVEKRSVVGYNEQFLHDYTPGKTYYLTTDQRKRLHQQCDPGSANFSELSDHDQSLFMCGLSYASSSLEGNQYDLASTEKLLVDGLAKDGASEEETVMVLNHREAVRYLIDNIHYPARRNDVRLVSSDVRNVHALLSQHLMRHADMCGTLRKGPVRIKNSSYIPAHMPEVIEREFLMIMDKAGKIEDPYEQAFFLLVHLPYLQPFEDCNKRTARVACNIPLLKSGVIPMSWMDVAHRDYIDGIFGVYERNNPLLLAEVFVDGYIRSSERFNVMRSALRPNAAVTRYRSILVRTVRAVVLGGDVDGFQEDVAPEDQDAFCSFVEQELSHLRRSNEAAMLRYRLEKGDVRAWIAREEGVAEADPAALRERERAVS